MCSINGNIHVMIKYIDCQRDVRNNNLTYFILASSFRDSLSVSGYLCLGRTINPRESVDSLDN